MVNKHTYPRFALAFVTFAVVLMFATTAAADTIYLKNGRTIRSANVRVEGDRVLFTQFGGEASLPMSLVDRIVEDENESPPTTTAPPTAGAPAVDATGSEVADEPAEEGDVEGEGEGEGAEEVPPEQTREYWQERVRSIHTERQDVELRIEDLRRQERAFLFSHRSTAETKSQIEAAQARLAELDEELRNLQREARRNSVPAGWLRLPSSGSS